MPEAAFIPAKPNLEQRLQQTAYNKPECISALRGLSLPTHLGNDVVRLCVLSGIRHHEAFALSPDISELCSLDGQEVFARARNARLIMSGTIPSREQMHKPQLYPYCIWNPQVASEDTYRKLVREFRDIRYQVGRACAVAGYAQLYDELDLLPDVSIAEEARESHAPRSGMMSAQIMATPTRYRVMNDYTRSINLKDPEPGACLNADTAVKATLKASRRFKQTFAPWQHFNITEDWLIAEEDALIKPSELTEGEIQLFNSPLPTNLPTMHKDLMILVAAFEGNADRYARLRRPSRILREFHCLVRGIYHSTLMANWLDSNPSIINSLKLHPSEFKTIRRAINARRVMNNSYQQLLDPSVPDDELPYWIWHPTIASSLTITMLAEARPVMRPQCARACIAAGYRGAYNKIMDMQGADGKSLAVDYFLMKEAQTCPQRDYFEPDVERRRQEQGLGFLPMKEYDAWKDALPWQDADPSGTEMRGALVDGGISVHTGQDGGIYEGLGVDMGPVLLYLSSTPEQRALARETSGGVIFYEDYRLQ